MADGEMIGGPAAGGFDWCDLPDLPTEVALHGAVRSVMGSGDGVFEYLVAASSTLAPPDARG